MKSQAINIQRELEKTYLTTIKNSLGTKVFKNFYAKVNGKSTDILGNGKLSCAFFVSSICVIFGLISRVHGTVAVTLKDLKKSGWVTTKKPKLGDILIWEESAADSTVLHKHIGFYIGKQKAISNSTRRKVPVIHHWTFGIKNSRPKRKIEVILSYNFNKKEKKN